MLELSSYNSLSEKVLTIIMMIYIIFYNTFWSFTKHASGINDQDTKLLVCVYSIAASEEQFIKNKINTHTQGKNKYTHTKKK